MGVIDRNRGMDIRSGDYALPDLGGRLSYIRTWITFWWKEMGVRATEITEGWHKTVARMNAERRRGRTGWEEAQSAMSSAILVLLDAGWRPAAPGTWLTPIALEPPSPTGRLVGDPFFDTADLTE